ncbi:hypothetical protein GCM10008018_34030 [Paenibacillus marchantiophytorum]|uniref:Uncharacterized protein n=1 Tax=Paenibacillus marchantiophytorum TaxID=1619310 RepID=A0ABQ1ETS0_9BACL|nr:hypothetical protein [Paenibacillus marchantiophytorum]GFZ85195.1 hypothetical protein GCM10008018_34030 [Paenibacillus marchantiophytorum]
MAVVYLRGRENTSEIDIHFEFLYHIPGEYEGSRIRVTFYRNKLVERTIDMGWTNIVLFRFINLMKNFPLEKPNGNYHHFEKHLEFHWIYEYSTDLYLLVLEDQGILFPLKTSKSELVKFGHALEKAVKLAPSLDSFTNLE